MHPDNEGSILKYCSLGTDVEYNAFFYTEQELFVSCNLSQDRSFLE